MKRKLGKKNIRLFVLFSFLVLLVAGLFGYGIWTAFSYNKNIYEISNGSFTYDIDNSYVSLEDVGTLQQKWDKKYYLSIKDKNKTNNKVYSLGTDVVIYNENDSNLKIYGTNYRIDSNGEVTYNDEELEVPRNSSPLFYKLDDRKYLMIGKSIFTEKKEIATTEYLIVEIDKNGNALLLNNQINIKTLSTITLKTYGYDFDVANERLVIPNTKKVIDLKKVSGSSNQYVEPSKETTTTVQNTTETSGGGGGGGYSSGGSSTGSSAATGSASTTIVSSSTANKSEELNIVKTAKITSVAAYTSYVDVFYAVNDPKGEYVSVYLEIEGSNGYKNKIVLNKDNTRYRIRNLAPSTEYSIDFCYSYTSSENSDLIIDDVSNSFIVRTSKNQSKINVTKISGRKIYFNVIFDKSYAYESANLVVYSDNVAIGRESINVTSALSANGYNGVIECDSSFGSRVILKLEDCKFAGEDVTSTVQTTFINN